MADQQRQRKAARIGAWRRFQKIQHPVGLPSATFSQCSAVLQKCCHRQRDRPIKSRQISDVTPHQSLHSQSKPHPPMGRGGPRPVQTHQLTSHDMGGERGELQRPGNCHSYRKGGTVPFNQPHPPVTLQTAMKLLHTRSIIVLL